MLVKEGEKTRIFSNGITENVSVYAGILELMARFGYVSLDEVMYGFGLSVQYARNRLSYLVRQELVSSFSSHVNPQRFYCLTRDGRNAIQSRVILDEINEFDPDRYRPFTQNHDRTLVRIFCALRRMLGSDWESWISEKNLRKQEGLTSCGEARNEKRVLDGFFQMKVHKKKLSQNALGDFVYQGTEIESWGCGLELELTMKSASRYRNQFDWLAECVVDRVHHEQKIPLMLFLCGSPAIFEALIKYQQERQEKFGHCVLLRFAQVMQRKTRRKKMRDFSM